MITLFAFFFTFSFSYVITIGVVWLTADDNDSPFTRFGTKGVLLRCAAFEFIPWIAGFVALAAVSNRGQQANPRVARGFHATYGGCKPR